MHKNGLFTHKKGYYIGGYEGVMCQIMAYTFFNKTLLIVK